MQVSLEDIQRDVVPYLDRVQAGETVVILLDGKPVAELKPVSEELKGLRPYGLGAGEFRVPDDFDAPLPPEILAAFEGA